MPVLSTGTPFGQISVTLRDCLGWASISGEAVYTRVVANTEPRNHMPPRGVTPTKALEAGGASNRGPVHSGQSCILELGNDLINV